MICYDELTPHPVQGWCVRVCACASKCVLGWRARFASLSSSRRTCVNAIYARLNAHRLFSWANRIAYVQVNTVRIDVVMHVIQVVVVGSEWDVLVQN